MTTLTDTPTADRPSTADDAAALRQFLATRDISCPNCGYNLRGLTSCHCPECGLDLTLRVNLAEPKLGAFIGGMVGLAVSFGFSAGFLSLIVSMGLIGRGGPPDHVTVYLALSSAISGGLLIAWIRGRSRLRRAAPPRRALMVAGCWIASIINVAMFPVLTR